MTKIVCISDTHGIDMYRVTIPDGDIIIHAGDFSSYGHQEDTKYFLKWFGALPHKHKVLIAGNHDKVPFERPSLFKSMVACFPGVHYLEDSEVNLEGLTIWGAPWTPTFLNWYFMADRGPVIKHHWDKIPINIDVLVTHGPPFGFLDLSNNRDHATGKKFTDHLGCLDLKEAVFVTKPLLHVFGHIHGSGGQQVNHIHADGEKTVLVNASIMDEAYQPIHKTITIEL